jgi:RNA polymerase sigma-B factor
VSSVVSELDLLRRYRSDHDLSALQALVRSLSPLVRHIAGVYDPHDRPQALREAAALGLMRAIDRYDASSGVALRTYVIRSMHCEVRRSLRDAWALHLAMGRPREEDVRAVRECTRRLTLQEGRSPTPQRVADELAIELEDVMEALRAGRRSPVAGRQGASSTDTHSPAGRV